MKIIISPAKKINDENDFSYPLSSLNITNKTKELYNTLRSMTMNELKNVIKASDAITAKTYDNLHRYDIEKGYLNAIMAYDGIQYQLMSPSVMSEAELAYLNDHLYILNGLYGYNKPFDLIIPHRLEMQSVVNGTSLYDYWSNDIAMAIDDDIIINLASNEYSRAVIPYLDRNKVYTISFKEEDNGRYIEKGVYVKMARGAMVRYMAENMIINTDDLKKFNVLDYSYNEELSLENHLIFTRRKV